MPTRKVFRLPLIFVKGNYFLNIKLGESSRNGEIGLRTAVSTNRKKRATRKNKREEARYLEPPLV